VPQITSAVAIGRTVRKVDSIVSLKARPMSAVGIVPMIMRGMSWPFSDLKSRCASAVRMFLMSFLKKTKMTTNVPMWRVTSKSIGMDRFRKCSASLRWPVLDMGNHSAMPCIMPRMIESSKVDKGVRLFGFSVFSG